MVCCKVKASSRLVRSLLVGSDQGTGGTCQITVRTAKKNGKNSSSSTLDNTKGRSRTKNGVKEKEDGKDGSDYIDKNFNFDDSSEKKKFLFINM